MITADGWFDWAERHPGPPEKVWSGTNAIAAVVMHSAVGTLQGVINIVMGPLQKSVTGVIGYDGRLVQFYPVAACPWANGSAATNRAYLGFENEGGAEGANVSEPQTDAQVETSIRILRDLADFKGIGPEFWQRPTTLKEHREFYATACPSDRIRWGSILAGLAPAPDPVIDGIGVVLDDGTDIGNILPALPEGRTVAGIGAHFTDGRIEGLWPK